MKQRADKNKKYAALKAVVLLVLCMLVHNLHAQVLSIYVSPTGASSGNGFNAASPVSLSQARVVAKANTNNPIMIWLQDGIYNTYIQLDSTDKRTAATAVTYRAINPGKALFQTITTLPSTAFQSLHDSIKDRIVDTTARKHVLQLNLVPYNLSNMNVWPLKFETGTIDWPRFYKDSVPLPMSQYPNDTATMRIRTVLDNGVNNVQPGGKFKYRDNRCQYWNKALRDGLWLKGNWRVPWQITYVKTLSITLTDSTIVQSVGIANGIGDKYTRPAGNGKEPYVAVNLVEEIDMEGEWAIDFSKKILYMWPPASGDIGVASNTQLYPVTLNKVDYVNVELLGVRGGASGAVRLTNCNYVRVAGIDVRYVTEDAIVVTGGTNCTIQSNDLHQLGAGGIIVAPASAAQFNADQLILTPALHKVFNNHIYDFAREIAIYSAAINFKTVIGCYAGYNKIHGTPHVGMLYDGNNNVMEFNEQYDIIRTYNDMGGFYRATGPKSRGNKIANNYMHDSPQGKSTFYDNGSQGDSSWMNIDVNNYFGFQNNGGYFNTYTNSIVVSASAAAASSSVIADTDPSFQPVLDSLKSIYNASAVYRAAYSETADMVGTGGINKTYASRIWPRYTCNVLIGNTTAFNGINDANLFNANGTTNSTYAQSGAPFTSYKTVVQNNFKIGGVLTHPVAASVIDSLKLIGAFAKTCNTNWRIHRIGLYNDAYRTDADQWLIPGIAPNVSLTASSNNGYVYPSVVTLSLKARNPNIYNCINSVKVFDNGTELTGVNAVVTQSGYDSVVYSIALQNLSVGTHTLTAMVVDTPYWKYASNTVSFNINAALPEDIYVRLDHRNCNPKIVWSFNAEQVQHADIEASRDGIMYHVMRSITPECTRICEGSTVINAGEVLYYRLRIRYADGKQKLSATMHGINPCTGVKGLLVFPNPQTGNTTTVGFYSQQPVKDALISVYNVFGKLQLQQTVQLSRGYNRIPLQTATLVNGNYMVQLKQGGVVLVASAILIVAK